MRRDSLVNTTDLGVAFVTGTLQLGGSTTFLCNIAGELVRRGVNCAVFCGDNLHPLAEDFERLRIPVSLHDHRRRIFEDRVESILRELHDYKPSVVVASLAPFSYEVLRYVPSGVRRIALVQADDALVYETVARYVDYIDIVGGVSSAIIRRLNEMDAFEGTCKAYLPYGVLMPDETVSRVRSHETLRILYLGRVINEQKRVYLFPQIAASLEKEGVPFHWTIAGDGPDRIALEAKMQSSIIASHVEFIGAVKYRDVPGLLASHDIFVLTSDYEGLPLSLLEAMGHGVVPVATDLESGVREVMDETNGMRVPIDDAEGYARAIVHLDRNRDELATKSAAARERVRTEFSVGAMADRWLRVLPAGSGQVTKWPPRFCVLGVLGDPDQWKYAAPVRSLRRILKRIRNF
jgi:glycosyltransferase involved in cell wall biosynthesis